MRTGVHTHNTDERRFPARVVPGGPLRLATVAAIAGGVLGLSATGPAAADPVSLTLRYTCSTGLIGSLPVTVRIHADVPETSEAGRPTPAFPVSAAVPVPADAARALAGIGVATVEGTVEAQVDVAAPEGDRRVEVPVDVSAGNPAAGAFLVEASGSAPALTFTQAGIARITVGDLVAHLVPKDARGHVVYPGETSARCTPDPGQNNVLASFRITGTGTVTGTDTGQATSGAQGTAGTAATPAAPPVGGAASGDAGPRAQGALPATGSATATWLLGGAGVLLAAGAGTLLATRRTRADGGPDAAAGP
ncbi:DUF6801 domain-containing protein [Streptomyces lavendulae]|uniref:DUF6801 domain-containing protein n=1 Tax=Streptomyces lavendulae TaxID=1914 RepID=UPI00367468CE